MTEPVDEPQRRAAARILALSRQYAQRSRDAEAALVREFQDAVREHVATLGPVTIEDDDDEQLVLTEDARFQGRVLITADGSTSWRTITAAADVVDYYEPVDLFSDLSDAILDQYPGADAAPAGPSGPAESLWFPGRGLPSVEAPGPAPSLDPTDDRTSVGGPSADLQSPGETESPSRTVLRDLHDAGVYTDAEYAAKLAELDRPAGA